MVDLFDCITAGRLEFLHYFMRRKSHPPTYSLGGARKREIYVELQLCDVGTLFYC